MKRTFRFYKTPSKEWFVDLPEWPGDIGELQMVEGADTFLDMLSDNANGCLVEMTDEKANDREVLKLVHIRETNLGSGGDYLLELYKGKPVHHKLWLCGVTEFVFGKMPQEIWFRKIKDQTLV